MLRFKSLLRFLSVWFGIVAILSISSASAFASEKLAPAGSKQGPEIFVQLGHSQSINTVAFSSDGRYALSGEGKMIKIWDVITGREIRTLVGHDATIRHVGISPDGKSIISIDGDIGRNTLKIWDINTGKEIETIPLSQPNIVYSLSKDSKYVLTANPVKDDEINLLDAITGNRIKTFQNRERNVTNNITLSRNNKYAASIYENGLVKIWDASSCKLLREIRGAQKIKIQGEEPIDITDDGRFVIFPEYDNNLNQELKLFDYKSGKLIRNIHKYGKNDPAFAMFSPDGKHILWAENNQKVERYVLHLEETTTGRKAWSSEDLASGVLTANFSPDRKYILAGQWNGGLKLWDISTAKEIRSFSGKTITERAFGYSPANNLVLSGTNLWDTSTGNIVTTIQGVDKSYLLLSPDGKNALAKEHKLLFDIRTGKGNVVFPAEQADLSLSKTIFSPEGRYILSDFEGTLKLWDIFNGNIKMTFKAHANFPGTDAVGFSPDGRYIISSGRGMGKEEKATLILWDINSGARIWVVTLDNIVAESLNFSPDGKLILLGDSVNNSPVIYSAADGRKIKVFEHSDFRTRTSCIAIFSPDGKYILSSDPSEDNVITLWDIATGKEIKLFGGHRGGVNSLAFTLDARHFLSNSYDGTTRLWDISTGKEIAQFISFTDGEWVVITPEGYFNASPNGAKHLNVRVGNNVYSIDNFYEKFFNPVYVASVLQGKKVEAVADIRKGVLTPPDVKITSPEPNKEFSTDTVTITVSAKDTGGGIDEIRLYHNGKAIGEDQRAVKIVPKGNEATKTYTVTLVDGANTFRATAFSKDRTESNPYELIVKLTAPSKDVSLYILAVGINKYKNPALNLNYAEPDAKGIVDFFKQKGEGLFKKVEIIDMYNEQATKEGITSKLKQLENTNPQDAVLIYLAGHGESIGDKWYFIPHELTYPEREEDVKTKGISSDELSGLIKNIKAQKILLLIDSCKSGAVLVAFRGFEDRKALSQLSRSTGVHIVAASTKDQFAAEVKELGHGVFTYILLEGLKGKAATEGKAVTVKKLMAYVEEQLPEITKKYKQEAQYPVTHSSGEGMDFPLVIVK